MVTNRRGPSNRDAALKRAYSFAKEGNGKWAQYWYNHACAFGEPTKRQIDYFIKCARQAGLTINEK